MGFLLTTFVAVAAPVPVILWRQVGMLTMVLLHEPLQVLGLRLVLCTSCS